MALPRETLLTETHLAVTIALLKGAWMPSIADELDTETKTPRSRVARSRRYGLVWESLVELMRISIAVGEYLKWISGFANAEGGVLAIGRNSKGDLPAHSFIKYLQVKLRGLMPRSANSMHTLSNLVAMS